MPVLQGGYVLGGGAICMELLTKQVTGYNILKSYCKKKSEMSLTTTPLPNNLDF